VIVARFTASVLLAAIACREPPPTSLVVMPRAAALTAEEAQRVQGFAYSPRDAALGWQGADSLVVFHAEQFAAGDVVASTCAGTGVCLVPFTNGGPPRPVRVGSPICDAGAPPGDVAFRASDGAIVYSQRVPENREQVVMLDGASAPRPVSVTCSPFAREPAISNDGSMLAMAGLCDGGGRGQSHWAVYVTSIGGGDRRRVAGGDSISAMMPAWSPDDGSLAIRLGDPSDPPHAQRLAVVDLRSGATRELVPGFGPSWSPDGQWIAFVHRDSVSLDDAEIRIVRPDGSGVRTVFLNPTRTTYVRGWGPMREGMVHGPLVWTRDSRGIVFGRAFDRGTSLWHVALDSAGTPRQLTESSQR
jgi:hypothetical protein